MKFATFGDSYVRRLDRYTGGHLDVGGIHRFFGVPGMSTHRKFDHMFEQLIDFRPSYVFLNLGGNDVGPDTDPEIVYTDIMEVVDRLYNSGVKRVFVASVLRRGKFPSWTGLDENMFNKIRNSVNSRLKKKLGEDFVEIGKRLQYPRHYDCDLVHPGEKEGGLRILQFCILNAFRKCYN